MGGMWTEHRAVLGGVAAALLAACAAPPAVHGAGGEAVATISVRRPAARPAASTVPNKAPATVPAAAAVRAVLAERLTPLARMAEAAAAVQLISDRGTGVVSNNGVGLVPQGGGNLVPFGGANIVPLGGGSLVPNGGANVIGNGGASLVASRAYRLPGFALLAEGPGAAGALPGEAYLGRTPRPDGSYVDSYAVGTAETRDVASTGDGRRLQEERTTGIVYHPNDNFRTGLTTRRLYAPDGTAHATLVYRETYDEAGAFIALRYEPSTFQVPGSSVDLAIEALTIDLATGEGTFHTTFRHLGLEERGTITQLVRRADGALAVNMADPLDLAGGTSTVTDAAGQVRYGRSVRLDDDGQHLTVDLGDGWTMGLERASSRDAFRGAVRNGGKDAGMAELVREASGAVTIDVRPDVDPTPLAISGKAAP